MSNLPLRLQALLVAGLLFLNLLVFNVLIRGAGLRVDLTEERVFSMTETTKRELATLTDRVEIFGYFSRETHEKLAPLVPRLMDLLDEYRLHGRGNVALKVLDPREDEEAEKEAAQRFGVKSVPIPYVTQFEQGVRSVYFHVVVAYGDQQEVLDLGELIQTKALPNRDVEVALKNPEYQLTSALRRVVRGFGSLASRLEALEKPIAVEAFLTSGDGLAPELDVVKTFLAEQKKLVEEAFKTLRDRYPTGVTLTERDPATDDATKAEAKRLGLRGLAVGAQTPFPVLATIIVRGPKKIEAVPLAGAGQITAFALTDHIEGSFRRMLPGALKKIGLVSPRPAMNPEDFQRGPPPSPFAQLKESLTAGFEVVDADLSSGRPPLDVDVLIVARGGGMDDHALYALDQYLMLGGRAIILADASEWDDQNRAGGIKLRPVEGKLGELLAHYGVTQSKELALDARNLSFPMRMQRMVAGFRLEEVVEVDYPWLIDVRQDGLDERHLLTAGFDQLAFMWAHPLTLDRTKQKDARYTELIRTSEKAWTSADAVNVDPKMPTKDEPEAYPVPEGASRKLLGVAIEGKLTSYFEGKAAPRPKKAEADPMAEAPPAPADDKSPLPEPVLASPEDTRLVVLGDSDIVSDVAFSITGASGLDRACLAFLAGAVDWALIDQDLLSIRVRGVRQRLLGELSVGERLFVQGLCYAVPMGLVVAFGLLRYLKRRGDAKRQRKPSKRQDGPGGEAPATAPKLEEVKA